MELITTEEASSSSSFSVPALFMDSITTEEASSSSSVTHSWTYDVFLSFRGEDTRHNFTGHLHRSLNRMGIRTFIDNELQRGEGISKALLEAIEGSMISVVIFSQGYPFSSWCLDELVHIMQCKNSKQQLVFPVFYKVDPSDIRHQTGVFKTAFANHECSFKDDPVQLVRWKAALKEAATLSGWHFMDGDESELIDDIVKEISLRVQNYTGFNVADHPVGIDSRVLHVDKLLCVGVNDVRMVGIWGMGGIGKTTIARAVYNTIAHNFEGGCFLENVREESMQYGGLVKLQNCLLSKIMGVNLEMTSVHEGINVIKKRLSKKRVLIVVDDVNQVDQLKKLVGRCDWFGFGSRIIITTRDKHLLTAHQVNLIYNVKELDDHEALGLFSANAFPGERRLSDHYVKLARTVVQYARGLPLVLVVLGSLLCGASVEEWQDALDGYTKIPNADIQETLKISYNSLEDPVKEVFLDIACFFKGENIDHVIQILEACGLNPKYGIKVLKEKALINVNEENFIWMHDLLEEMGKEIVRQESPAEPGKRSRLWFHEDVDQVLTKGLGTNKIKGIMVKSSPRDGNALSFSKMINLKLLIVSNARFSGEAGFLPNELRFVDWPEFSSSKYLPFDSNPKRLLKLNMPRSYMSGLGVGFKSLKNLISINLESCIFLREFPDASGFPYLKDLNLKYCGSLVQVHHSVGFLEKLVALSLEGCGNLTLFPTRIALKSVKDINLRGCRRLKYFPEIVDKMECIIFLDLSQTAITELPSSIGYLISLEVLTLEECENLTNLPCSIYELQHLMSINLLGCRNLVSFPKWSAESLPTNSNVSPDLWYLNLGGCKSLEEIPELPPKMERVNAADCVSLERFAKLSNILEQTGEQMIECVTLFNCQKLCDNLAGDLSKNQNISLDEVSLCSVIFSSVQTLFDVVFPGSEVPKWFSHREDLSHQRDKSEFSFEIPPHLNLENIGLAICAVAEISQKGKEISQKEKEIGQKEKEEEISQEIGQKEKDISQKGKEVGQKEKEEESSVFCKSYGVHLVMPQDEEDLKDEDDENDGDEETSEALEDEEDFAKISIGVELSSSLTQGLKRFLVKRVRHQVDAGRAVGFVMNSKGESGAVPLITSSKYLLYCMLSKPLLEQVVSVVKKHSQSGTIRIQPICDQEEEEEEEMAANDQRALEDYAQPIIPNSPSCILQSTKARNYELKSSNFQILPSFYGLLNEDPLVHIKEFYNVVGTFPLKDVSEANMRMRVFPYTLKDRAKTWLMSLTPGSLTTWDAVAKKFLEKFFSTQKTATLRAQIFNFSQHDGEPFNDCWKHFKGTLIQFPHHGLPLYLQMQFFYDGLTQTCQSTVYNVAGGSLKKKNAQEVI
ncbi:TMV resistance protein N-like [Prunus avium]|uniref:TMV resistance protein N-like n=1 Tax=Prunus avium TaxID=42229 RepID=A0A6P5RFQ2_PRUAV|nr:TMV resistance protein N-like [Prunus avium]